MNIRPVSSEMASESQESRLSAIQMQIEEMQEAIDDLSDLIRLEDDTLTIEAPNIVIHSGRDLTLRANSNFTAEIAGRFEVTASSGSFNIPHTNYTGNIQCTVIQATTVSGATYTPGAGNLW